MKFISHQIKTYYEYNGKFYAVSDRKDFRVNDMFIDGRDYGVKIVEDVQDLFDLAYMVPEMYVILEEATVLN